MKAVDLNRVAGLQALDAEGNVLGMVSMEEITDSVAARIADAISSDKTLLPAASRPRAAAATGSDKMENALGETTDPAYVRVIDKSGNSARQSIQSLAQVAGGLIGVATDKKDGLLSKMIYISRLRSKEVPNLKIVSFLVPRYTRGVLKLYIVSTQNDIFFKECSFIVDMNTGVPKGYGIEGMDIKYSIGNQVATIYIKPGVRSTTNLYFSYAEILNSNEDYPINIIDEFPSNAIELI